MADHKNPNEHQAGEKPEGKFHYNPGNQSGKTVKPIEPEDNAGRADNTKK